MKNSLFHVKMKNSLFHVRMKNSLFCVKIKKFIISRKNRYSMFFRGALGPKKVVHMEIRLWQKNGEMNRYTIIAYNRNFTEKIISTATSLFPYLSPWLNIVPEKIHQIHFMTCTLEIHSAIEWDENVIEIK